MRSAEVTRNYVERINYHVAALGLPEIRLGGQLARETSSATIWDLSISHSLTSQFQRHIRQTSLIYLSRKLVSILF